MILLIKTIQKPLWVKIYWLNFLVKRVLMYLKRVVPKFEKQEKLDCSIQYKIIYHCSFTLFMNDRFPVYLLVLFLGVICFCVCK